MNPTIRKLFVVGLMVFISIVLFRLSDYLQVHHIKWGIPSIDWIFEGPVIADLAGSFFVIPIVYLLLESVIDEQFKGEIRQELRGFVAEPESIIPHIEVGKLDLFTATLLDKLFDNKELSKEFVKTVNKHKSRYSNPIDDYRVNCVLSEHSSEYFKLDTSVSTTKVNKSPSSNITVACQNYTKPRRDTFYRCF